MLTKTMGTDQLFLIAEKFSKDFSLLQQTKGITGQVTVGLEGVLSAQQISIEITKLKKLDIDAYIEKTVSPTDDKIYLCNPTDKHLLIERKSLSFKDYVDEEIDGFSIVSSSGKQVTMNTIIGLDLGYLVYSTSSIYSVITAIDALSKTITVKDVRTWPVGAITINKSVAAEIEYTSQHCDNPGVTKLWQEVAMLYRETNFLTGTISFYTDISGDLHVTCDP